MLYKPMPPIFDTAYSTLWSIVFLPLPLLSPGILLGSAVRISLRLFFLFLFALFVSFFLLFPLHVFSTSLLPILSFFFLGDPSDVPMRHEAPRPFETRALLSLSIPPVWIKKSVKTKLDHLTDVVGTKYRDNSNIQTGTPVDISERDWTLPSDIPFLRSFYEYFPHTCSLNYRSCYQMRQ